MSSKLFIERQNKRSKSFVVEQSMLNIFKHVNVPGVQNNF